MALEMVRDEGVEEAILNLLEDDDEIWNISKLQRKLNCSRRKVEISVGVLQEQGLVVVKKLKPSWVIMLPRRRGNEGGGV